MTAASSDNPETFPYSKKMNLLNLSAPQRARLFLWNYFPLFHAALGLWFLFFSRLPCWQSVFGFVLLLYFLPPLLARLLSPRSIPQGILSLGSTHFMRWWALCNLQILYCRLPFLEETLRLVPGLYSFWLRLWGSKIGRLTYWAPGTMVLDRSFLDIGNDVIFGAGVRLNPHVLTQKNGQEFELSLADVKIGDQALIGGYCLLTSGSEVKAGECVQADTILPPFNVYQDGKRFRKSRDFPE